MISKKVYKVVMTVVGDNVYDYLYQDLVTFELPYDKYYFDTNILVQGFTPSGGNLEGILISFPFRSDGYKLISVSSAMSNENDLSTSNALYFKSAINPDTCEAALWAYDLNNNLQDLKNFRGIPIFIYAEFMKQDRT